MTSDAQAPSGQMTPVVDDITRPYWESAARGVLSIQKCSRCDLLIHAPMVRCPRCHRGDALGWCEVSGRGTIYSSITVHGNRLPGFRNGAPHVVAMIELAEQPRLFVITNVSDCEPADVTVGARVEVHFDDTLDGVTLPQFRLVRRVRNDQR
ncbi:Zn-ribbon domain-containing OB-fold protein [Williamsia sp. DF01-3]|uniref:Zn-ribbon domain-containing OB-fold protein n=1 Tax=Williamsia sp. DF01-3 TaxID=2934157 RepID=UPI001FF4B5B2|nr:OB-fold domain-containing protein [Williamsia sp. DF01-3]MCK0516730.1 OB-fold domain-containing protein [Williamsia sp. DF01-3]